MLTSGQLLAERYRLGNRIAVGGMGEVWQAVDVRLDRTVAIKVLKPELCGDAEFLHRFRTEARTTASLNHHGIAAVHDYGETAAIPDGPEDTAYLVMELVDGEPLASILARKGRIHADRALDMLEQAGRALQAAHEQGLVHRDVKPGNILITSTGLVKLTDFGIAKAADAAPVTRSGMVMGTAHYIAPEQALGSDATTASDVYSLAVVGYECLMGHRPFLSENAVTVAMMHIRDVPPPLPPDVPPGVRALIEATLTKDPRRRYAAGGEFAHAASSVRAGMPLPTPTGLATPQVPAQPPPRQMTSGVHPVPQNTVAPQNAVGHQNAVAQNPAVRNSIQQSMPPNSAPQGSMTPQNSMPQGAVGQQGAMGPGGPNTMQHMGMGNTYPPGVIPAQATPRARTVNRTGLWVVLATVLLVVIVIIGLAVVKFVAQPAHPMSRDHASATSDRRALNATGQAAPRPGSDVRLADRPTRGDAVGETMYDAVVAGQRHSRDCGPAQ